MKTEDDQPKITSDQTFLNNFVNKRIMLFGKKIHNIYGKKMMTKPYTYR